MNTSPTIRTDRPPSTTTTARPAPSLVSAVLASLLLLPAVPTLLDGIHRRSRRLAGGRDAGVSVVEWLLITTIIAGAAIAIGAIVVAEFTSKANELDLTTP
ncbi:hypothetical protein [Aquipuribacter sp. MA13-13]|uniref:hypothetical protein n=1 Tax=Aquipuribacter sp. MA13-13 TaxID=3440840 RepID=UPI003EEC65AB